MVELHLIVPQIKLSICVMVVSCFEILIIPYFFRLESQGDGLRKEGREGKPRRFGWLALRCQTGRGELAVIFSV